MGVKEIEKSIYTTFADIATTIGYSEIHGRIIGALLVKGPVLSLQETADETGYSASAISISLNLLEILGLIRKVKKVGDRKLYIELHGDLLNGLKKAFLMRLEKGLGNTLNEFKRYKKDLKVTKGRERDKVQKTLNILEKEVKRVNNYVTLLSKIRLP